jgi:hypothetical protein
VASVTGYLMEDMKHKLLLCWVCTLHLFSLTFTSFVFSFAIFKHLSVNNFVMRTNVIPASLSSGRSFFSS